MQLSWDKLWKTHNWLPNLFWQNSLSLRWTRSYCFVFYLSNNKYYSTTVMLTVSTIRKNIYRWLVQHTNNFWVLWSFQTVRLFQIKLHLLNMLSAVLCSGFQIHWVNFTGLVVIVNAAVYKTKPIFNDTYGKKSKLCTLCQNMKSLPQ